KRESQPHASGWASAARSRRLFGWREPDLQQRHLRSRHTSPYKQHELFADELRAECTRRWLGLQLQIHALVGNSRVHLQLRNLWSLLSYGRRELVQNDPDDTRWRQSPVAIDQRPRSEWQYVQRDVDDRSECIVEYLRFRRLYEFEL